MHSVMRHYIHAGPAAFRFDLAGDLDANDAATLERERRSASLTIAFQAFRLLATNKRTVTKRDVALPPHGLKPAVSAPEGFL